MRQSVACCSIPYYPYLFICPTKSDLQSNKHLSYRRETTLQGESVLAKSGRRYPVDIVDHTFNHCDVIDIQSYRI